MRRFVIRCPIHGSIELDELEFKLLENRACQRLRNISQLGFANYVYPSANHNRFSHALGAMHLVGKIFDHLAYLVPKPLSKYISKDRLSYYRRILRLTALLHDLGHLPFSHSSEEIFPKRKDIPQFHKLLPYQSDLNAAIRHEDLSAILIVKLAQEKYLTASEAADVIALLSGRFDVANSDSFNCHGFNLFYLLSALINSELDVDRMDYLLRDSYHSGVSYGRFDLEQLLRSYTFYLDQQSGRFDLALHQGGILAFEDMLLGRELMFNQVYFHKTLLCFAEIFKQVVLTKEIKFDIWQDLNSYIRQDDITIGSLIEQNKHKFWCQLIYRRQPLKLLLRTIDPQTSDKQEFKRLQQTLQDAKIPHFKITRQVRFFDSQSNSKSSLKLVATKFGEIKVSNLGTMLKNKKQHITIWQLNLFAKDYLKTLKLIKKLSPNGVIKKAMAE